MLPSEPLGLRASVKEQQTLALGVALACVCNLLYNLLPVCPWASRINSLTSVFSPIKHRYKKNGRTCLKYSTESNTHEARSTSLLCPSWWWWISTAMWSALKTWRHCPRFLHSAAVLPINSLTHTHTHIHTPLCGTSVSFSKHSNLPSRKKIKKERKQSAGGTEEWE